MNEVIVYVALNYVDYEGYSRPLAVFTTEREAEIFKLGSEAAYGNGLKIYPMVLDKIYSIVDVPTTKPETGKE